MRPTSPEFQYRLTIKHKYCEHTRDAIQRHSCIRIFAVAAPLHNNQQMYIGLHSIHGMCFPSRERKRELLESKPENSTGKTSVAYNRYSVNAWYFVRGE